MLLCVTYVAGVVEEDGLAQVGCLEVRVYLCSADALMTEECLYYTQVGTALEQRRGKAVAQGVRRDGLGDAGPLGVLLDHDENHGAREVRPAPVEEYIVFFARFDVHHVAVVVPVVQFLYGFGRDGHEAFLAALAQDADKGFLFVDIAQLEVDEFADTQAAGEENLDDGLVALSFPFAQVDGSLQTVYFFHGKVFGQMLAYLGRLQQFGGVVLDVSVQLKETVERPYAAEDASLRPCPDAHVVNAGREMLQVGQLQFGNLLAAIAGIRCEKVEVVAVCLQRVVGVVALQFEKAHVLSCNFRT